MHFRDQHKNVIEKELANARRVRRALAGEKARKVEVSFEDDPYARWIRLGVTREWSSIRERKKEENDIEINFV